MPQDEKEKIYKIIAKNKEPLGLQTKIMLYVL